MMTICITLFLFSAKYAKILCACCQKLSQGIRWPFQEFLENWIKL